MAKSRKFVAIVFSCCMLVIGLFCIKGFTAYAQTEETCLETETQPQTSASPRGWITNISIALGGGNGEVWAEAENVFTLFSSTIWVMVELYSSTIYQESYTTMVCEKSASVGDLNMGEKLIVSVPTNGVQKYWQARMRYKFDNRDIEEKTTRTFLCDAQGVQIGA